MWNPSMFKLKGKYTIKEASRAFAKALQAVFVICLIAYSNLFDNNIVMHEYDIFENEVSFKDEKFLVRNSYLRLAINKKECIEIIQSGEPFAATVVGFNMFDGILKRRIVKCEKEF